ncbi:MAG TPA: ribosome maturation factor RimP [bacterium]
MTARQGIARQVDELARPITERMGLEVVDVQVSGGGKTTILRVLVDRPDGGITVEECARVNESLSRQLDLYDLFPHAYTLEVSSPGLDRPLHSEADFRRFAGRRAEVVMAAPMEGQRRFRGRVLGVVAGAAVLEIDERQVHLPLEQMASAKLTVEMEDLRADLSSPRPTDA